MTTSVPRTRRRKDPEGVEGIASFFGIDVVKKATTFLDNANSFLNSLKAGGEIEVRVRFHPPAGEGDPDEKEGAGTPST